MERITAAQYRDLIAKPPAEKRDITPPKAKSKRKISAKRIRKPKGLPTYLSAITRLMERRPLSNLRLKNEEILAIEFANTLRALTLEGRLKCVWTHPANEIAGMRDRRAQIRYAIGKAMGLIDGTADYLFLWGTGSGALEAKVGKNGQQPNQIDFQVWCQNNGVPYETFTSIEEGLSILQGWGICSSS